MQFGNKTQEKLTELMRQPSAASFTPIYAFESRSDSSDLYAKLTDLADYWDCQRCPFGTNARLTVADVQLLSFPFRSAVASVIGSHFVSRNGRRLAQAEADLGYKVYSMAVEAAQAGIACCITQSFDNDSAVRTCAKVHSLEFECPVAIAVGFACQSRHFFHELFQWWNADTYRLPLESILKVDAGILPAKVVPAIEAVRKCFSLGNAQNWQIGWTDSSVLFFVTSELDVRYVNAGFALAAFEFAARNAGIKGNFTVDEALVGKNEGYLASWVIA
jgi:hypothetical protein